MNLTDLTNTLASKIPAALASDLVSAWAKLRMDTATQTLEKATAGKFVETFVQILEHLETQNHSSKPDVDAYLRKLDDRAAPALGDDLRICAARQARAMYTLRNKRNIAHKNDVDPNVYDQRVLYSQAQWVLSELLRFVTGTTMSEAGRLIAQVQMPVNPMVEQIDSRRLVLLDLSASTEILVLLHHAYPNWVSRDQIFADMDRRPTKTVSNELGALWRARKVEKSAEGKFKLTAKGFTAAGAAIQRLA